MTNQPDNTTRAPELDGQLQLDIFTSMRIEPTIAMRRGDAYLTQCAYCGTLLAVPSPPRPHTIGPCPICNHTRWWRQDTNAVGPYRIAATEPGELDPKI